MKLKLKTKILPVLVLCALILGAVFPASALVQAEPYDIYEKITLYDPYNQIRDDSYIQILDDTQDQKYVPGEIIVKFEPGVSGEKIANINSRHGTKEIYTSSYAGFKLLKIPKSKTVEEMVEIYSKNPNVEYALPNAITHVTMVPNDPLYGYQWNFKYGEGGINVEAGWEIGLETLTGQGVVVAVLDTGVAYENYGPYIIAPDLSNTNFVPGYDFVNNDAHPNDDNYHGTHVTGTIAQNTNDGYGVAGIAYGSSIMPVKVLSETGEGTLQQLIDGIYFATNNGADIISMSLSFAPGYYPGQALDDALENAYQNGVTIIAAAGNEQTGMVDYPAAYYRCIAVGATNYNGVLADYSNYGTEIDVVAPGGDSQDLNGDGYMDGILQNTFNPQTKDPTDFNWWFLTGTSMATPHVTGIAALLLEENSEATPDDIREAIEYSARDMGDPGWDQYYGHGLVDTYGALKCMIGIKERNFDPEANAGGPYSAEKGQNVTFDGSGSYDPDGYIMSYEWDFGDGSTGSGVAPVHAYSTAGSYNITLTVWDDNNNTDTNTTTAEITEVLPPVNNPPIADAGGPYSAEEGQNVTFDGSGSYDPDGYIMSYEWDFGDGSTGSGVAPVHAYSTAGIYNATLTVWDDKNTTDIDSAAVEITEMPPPVNNPPVANAGGPYSAEGGQLLSFDGSGSYDPEGYIVSYEWDFGDGNTGSGVSPEHSYSSPGTYNATLTVRDDKNATGTDTTTVEVIQNFIHIEGVSITTTGTKITGITYVTATAVVTVLDSNNNPVEGASVSGYWSVAASDADSALTDGTGKATVCSDEVICPKKGTLTFTFTVNNVSHMIQWDGNTASGTAVYP